MVTYGEVAFRAFYDSPLSREWEDERDHDRDRWERAARAVILAYADAPATDPTCVPEAIVLAGEDRCVP